MRPPLILGLILTLAAPIQAEAQTPYTEPYPTHRAIGLLVGPGLGYTEAFRGDTEESGLTGHLDLGASFTVGDDRNEFLLLARPGVGGSGFSLGLIATYRNFFGHEGLQTFVDLGVVGRLFSGAWVGPRLGFGLRHALSENVFVLGGLGLSVGFGSGLRLDAEGYTGVQWTFPL